MDDKNKTRPHLYLGRTGKAESYTASASGGPKPPEIPPRNRQRHGGALMAQLQSVSDEQRLLSQEAAPHDLESLIGIQVEFESFPGIELAVHSLADARSRIELMNVRQSDGRVFATIFVPEGKLTVIEAKLQAYLDRKKDKNGAPRDNRTLIDAIAAFRVAAIEALWTDAQDQFPQDDQEAFWWEVWLPARDSREAVIHDFKRLAATLDIRVAGQVLEFPERSVMLAKGMRSQFSKSGLLLNCISELRRAKETAAFFDELEPVEQPQWADDLLRRLERKTEGSPCVCILDTGVNLGHPMLGPFLGADDQYTVDPNWTEADDNGHGTGMAGLSVWGDLTEPLAQSNALLVAHRLESVKILRHAGDNEGKHYGVITADAVALPEISSPERTRVFTMALTTKDSRDRGRPSAWSSAVDGLAVDYLGEGSAPRLIALAAGNIEGSGLSTDGYTDLNLLQDVHDPGQAWNALTVGAYTEKTDVCEQGYV